MMDNQRTTSGACGCGVWCGVFWRAVIRMLGMAVIVAGCAGSAGAPHESVRSLGYRPGFPSFEVECIPRITTSGTGAEVHLKVSTTTLMFLRVDGGYAAITPVLIHVADAASGDHALESAWTDTILVPTYGATQAHPPLRLQRFLPLQPGTYAVTVQLEDAATGKRAERRHRVVIPAAIEGVPTLAGIMLFRRGQGEDTIPVVEFHVPLREDTFAVDAGVMHVPSGTGLNFELSVLRYRVSTGPAVPPYWFSGSDWYSGRLEIMEGRKIYPENTDSVWSIQGKRTVGELGTFLSADLPPLDEGVYRLGLRAWSEDQRPADAAEALRYFVLVGPAFPRPVVLDELIGPLAYLASRAEMAQIDTIAGGPERRRAFERFWLTLFPDPARAAAMMRHYYGRVEEANRLFSSFKPGWKTDRGMVYIVYGPPDRVEKRPDTEVWYYSHPGTYAENTFLFRRFFFAPPNLSVEDYLLLRGRGYEISWERRVQKLREGVMY